MRRLSPQVMPLIAFLLGASSLAAQTFTALAAFPQYARPFSLIQGTDGNFYAYEWFYSVLVKITPSGTLTTFYSFTNGTPAGLIQGSDGNFYGTVQETAACSGVVFQLTPGGTYTQLAQLPGVPVGPIIQATDGDLYGTTSYGGACQGPPAYFFKVTTAGNLTILYNFPFTGQTTVWPVSGVAQGSDGNFYGIATFGGTGNCNDLGVLGCGVIFKITPSGAYTTLYNFQGSTDGAYPVAPLTAGTDGNLYGTTEGFYYSGSSTLSGSIFRITPSGTFSTLATLPGTVDGGAAPATTLIPVQYGSLYGTAAPGNANNGGEIFIVTSSGAITSLYSLCAVDPTTCTSGSQPSAMLMGKDGNLYGLTTFDGGNGGGEFFKFTPPAQVAPPPPPPTLPAINNTNGVENGASFQAGIAGGSFITINGTNLSTVSDNWNNAIVNGALPTKLDGVSVSVGGEPAYMEYVSQTQINAIAPTVSSGSMPVTVTNSVGTSSVVMAQTQAAQPAFFQWGNYAVATNLQYSYVAKNGTISGAATQAAQAGQAIVLWGTGFGPTTPAAPVGFEAPATTVYNTANAVTVTVGGMPATVYGASLAPGFAGLYQVAIQVPNLASGDYPIVATVAGVQSPSTTLLTVQE